MKYMDLLFFGELLDWFFCIFILWFFLFLCFFVYFFEFLRLLLLLILFELVFKLFLMFLLLFFLFKVFNVFFKIMYSFLKLFCEILWIGLLGFFFFIFLVIEKLWLCFWINSIEFDICFELLNVFIIRLLKFWICCKRL